MKILIIYGTTEGQTRKVAQFLRDEAEKLSHHVILADANEIPPLPFAYDVVLIGASIHMGRYQSSVFHYSKTYAETLNKMNSGFFSVNLASVNPDDKAIKERDEHTKNFLDGSGWKPKEIEQIAGALRYTQYDFFKRTIMRMIAKNEGRSTDVTEDCEYTDWEKVKEFLIRITKA